MKKMALYLCASFLYANEGVYDLGVVEISTNKEDICTLNIEKISEENMKLNNVFNVTQTAIMTSGVSIKGGSGSRNENMINVRGFSSTRVPVYIDGIPVSMPYDGNMDLNRFTTTDLSQIDISKGTSSVLYGANSLGGVINLIGKKPKKDFEASLSYGFKYGETKGENNKNIFNQHGDLSLGSKQEKFYLQLNSSFLNSFNAPFANGVSDENDLSYQNKTKDKKINLKAGFTPNDFDEYSVNYSLQKGEKTGKMYQGNNPSFVGKDRYWYWPDWNKESFYFLSNTNFENVYVKSKFFLDKFDNELRNMNDFRFKELSKKPKGGGGFISNYDDYSFGTLFEFGVNIGENDIVKFAPSYKKDVHKERDRKILPTAFTEPWQKSKDEMYGLALENIHAFSEDTILTIGARYDKRRTLQASEYGKPEWSSVVSLFDFPTKDDDAFSYQALIEHNLENSWHFYGSFAKKNYFPTMKERFSSKFNTYKQNPNLSVESSYNYELGFRKNWDNFDINSAIFYSDLDDKIVDVVVGKSGTKDIMQKQNIANSEIYGLELAANANIKNFKIGANYTYLHGDAKQEGIYLTDVPRHKYFAFLDYKVNNFIRIYLSQFGQTHTHSNSDGSYPPAGFSVSNLKLIYDANKHLSFDVGVENLFDKAYAYTEGYYESGRAFFLNMRYNY